MQRTCLSAPGGGNPDLSLTLQTRVPMQALVESRFA